MPVVFTPQGSQIGQALIPAPLVTVRRDYVRSEDGKILHPEYTYTLNGSIVNIGNNLDSPNSVGYAFGNMEGVLAEERRIREIFSIDGGRLEVSTPPAGGPNTIDAYCTVESVDFQQSTWTVKCDYTIVLRSKKSEGDGENITELQSFHEDWSINENIDKTFSLSHQLRAIGALTFGPSGTNDPLTAAKNWCKNHSYTIDINGILTPVATGSLTLTNLVSNINPIDEAATKNFWNYSLTEGVGPYEYSWNLAETFIYNPSGIVREEWTATTNYETDNPRKITISINGNIYGFADRNSNLSLRNQRARSYYQSNVEPNLFTRIASYANIGAGGFTVNPVFSTKQVTYEETAGVVRYSTSYNASSGTLISGAVEESVNVLDVGPNDVFAQIPIPGRANGPLIQYMNTRTLPERTISINALMINDASSLNPTVNPNGLLNFYTSRPNTDFIINALKPDNGNYYLKQNSIDWNPIKRQYNRTVSWTLQPEGQAITNSPSGIISNPKP